MDSCAFRNSGGYLASLLEMQDQSYTQVTRVMQKTVDAHGDSVIIQSILSIMPIPRYIFSLYWQIYKKNVGLVLNAK